MIYIQREGGRKGGNGKRKIETDQDMREREMETYYIVQASLKLMAIFLLQPYQCWGCRHVSQCLSESIILNFQWESGLRTTAIYARSLNVSFVRICWRGWWKHRSQVCPLSMTCVASLSFVNSTNEFWSTQLLKIATLFLLFRIYCAYTIFKITSISAWRLP